MFTRKTENETLSLLDAEIVTALAALKNLEKTSDEYGNVIDRISKLHKLKAEESPKRVSPDNALVVAANLVGILAIIHHERVGLITSKAVGFILKPR